MQMMLSDWFVFSVQFRRRKRMTSYLCLSRQNQEGEKVFLIWLEFLKSYSDLDDQIATQFNIN